MYNVDEMDVKEEIMLNDDDVVVVIVNLKILKLIDELIFDLHVYLMISLYRRRIIPKDIFE